MKNPKDMTIEELLEVTRSVMHRMPKPVAEAIEAAMAEGKNLEIADIIDDYVANLRKQTS